MISNTASKRETLVVPCLTWPILSKVEGGLAFLLNTSFEPPPFSQAPHQVRGDGVGNVSIR
jgi:hypothetical protein